LDSELEASANQACSHSSSQETTHQSESLAVDRQLTELGSRIGDLGYEIDSRKATVARSMGGAVFLLMLALGAAYDLVTHNAALLVALGVTRETLIWVAVACGLVGLALLAHALVWSRLGDQTRDAELSRLEQDYTELLDRKDSASQADS
jgi:hypothetical protein